MCPALWPGCLSKSRAGRNALIVLGSRGSFLAFSLRFRPGLTRLGGFGLLASGERLWASLPPPLVVGPVDSVRSQRHGFCVHRAPALSQQDYVDERGRVSSQGARSLAEHGAEEAPAEWTDIGRKDMLMASCGVRLCQQWDAFCMFSAPSWANPMIGQHS